MKIKVRVKPGSKQEKIEKREDFYFVWVKERAEKGKANKEVIKLISSYFDVPKNSVIIKTGERNRDKIIEIIRDENE